MAGFPEPEPDVDHSTVMGLVTENPQTASYTHHDMYAPSFQPNLTSPSIAGNVTGGKNSSQTDSLVSRAHAAEEIADKLLDDLTAAQARLQQALADSQVKDRRIRDLEAAVGQSQQQQESMRASLVGQQQATAAQAQVEGLEAKVRELEKLVEFFRGNSEQSSKKVRMLQDENRRLKSSMPRGS